MLQSKIFTKTQKEAPKDEVSKNAELLIRAGFIHKNMAGVYEFLPYGLRVMRNISEIVRKEMNAIDGVELKMTVLQDPKPWQASDRWDDKKVDNWFKTELKAGGEVGIGMTHEEPLAQMLTQYIRSYRDLPIYPYQIQVKFRNELRAKSGLMRGREFVMKDLYSFSRTEEERAAFYEACAGAYQKIFDAIGIGDQTFRTKASGGIFAKYSDEFQMLTESGEDIIYLDEDKKLAVNKEIIDDESVLTDNNLNKDTLVEKKAVEVGNIFALGIKYAEAVGLKYVDENGEEQYPIMGSYGIGISRLMGAIVELHSDERGIIWPQSIAPFSVHLISLSKEESAKTESEKLYKDLQEMGVEVLYDDREGMSAGERFAEADLIGIPCRVVISDKTQAEQKVELRMRGDEKEELVTTDELIEKCKAYVQ